MFKGGPHEPSLTDYATTMREFRLDVPARFNWAFDTFDAWARDPARLALLWVSADTHPSPSARSPAPRFIHLFVHLPYRRSDIHTRSPSRVSLAWRRP